MRSIVRNTLLAACSLALMTSAASADTIQGKVICRGVRDCAGALVYIEKIPGRTFAPPRLRAVMDQANLRFVPHVLPVVVGTNVAFPNSDEVRHNVFSTSPAKPFNLGTYPRDTTKHLVFDRLGVVEVLCSVHTEMSAYVVVIETPYVAQVAPDGTYVLKDVPAGKYVICAWREELKEQRREVTVREGESLTLNLDLRR